MLLKSSMLSVGKIQLMFDYISTLYENLLRICIGHKQYYTQ